MHQPAAQTQALMQHLNLANQHNPLFSLLLQVWLNTGGVQGESPMCQTPALLETAGIPYVGHSPLNAALLDDKGLFKLACRGLGIQTAPFIVHNAACEPCFVA
jgi:D-alanine-D-alanine ligase-like ATP-grasp enzyme